MLRGSVALGIDGRAASRHRMGSLFAAGADADRAPNSRLTSSAKNGHRRGSAECRAADLDGFAAPLGASDLDRSGHWLFSLRLMLGYRHAFQLRGAVQHRRVGKCATVSLIGCGRSMGVDRPDSSV